MCQGCNSFYDNLKGGVYNSDLPEVPLVNAPKEDVWAAVYSAGFGGLVQDDELRLPLTASIFGLNPQTVLPVLAKLARNHRGCMIREKCDTEAEAMLNVIEYFESWNSSHPNGLGAQLEKMLGEFDVPLGEFDVN